jgi:hypothetical protein
MADDVYQRIEDALETLVNITEKSGNLRKNLKQDTLVSVSSLRKEISTLKLQLKSAVDEQKKLSEEVKNAREANVRGDRRTTGQVAPCLDHNQQYVRGGLREVAPSEGGRRNYAEAVKQVDKKRCRISLTPKD